MNFHDIKSAIHKSYLIFKKSLDGFIDDNAITLSASLSFYTVFSLPPLLILVVYTCGVLFGTEAVSGEIFSQINIFVGPKAALQIQEIIIHAKVANETNLAAVVGIIVLIIGSSGVFSEMQSSIDFILGLKAKPKNGWIKYIKNRLLSFSMIGALLFLLLVGLFINVIMNIINSNLILHLPKLNGLIHNLNIVMVYIVIVSLFTAIYKLLPDGIIKWKYAFAGSLFSAFFFLLGKYVIGVYLGASSIATLYGAAGSVIIILIWVYYTAIVLYFGAEIVKAYIHTDHMEIKPNEFSVNVAEIEIELPEK